MGGEAGGEDGDREAGAVDHQGDGPQPGHEGQDHDGEPGPWKPWHNILSNL